MRTLKFFGSFFLTVVLLLGMLVLAAFVPRSAIAPKMLESAKYLCEGELFGEAVDGVQSTRIDRYADSILLGIAWQFDSRNALRSVIEAGYYHLPYQNENENLLDAVKGDLGANQQYLRYWHGSAGIVRILMLFLNLQQIYFLHGVILGTMFLMLLFRLFRCKERNGEQIRTHRTLAIGLAFGAVGAAVWFVPLSLEYTWVFLILVFQMHLVISSFFPKEWNRRYMFFMISGMITNYLDFLTCETLTLLIPLLALIWLDHGDQKREKNDFKQSLKSYGRSAQNTFPSHALPWRVILNVGTIWLVGYCGMFLVKWVLAAIIMGENVLPYVAGHIEERTIGSVGTGFIQEWLGAPLRNIRSLFPADWGAPGLLAAVILAIGLAYVGYVYHRTDFDKELVARMATLGMVPYIRYLLLANHSYLHLFFTFRAQMSTLLALILILCEVTGWGIKERIRNGHRSPLQGA